MALVFGFIGSGRMALLHAEALRHLGHSIACLLARPGSSSAVTFAQRNDVPCTVSNRETFFQEAASGKLGLDGLVLCTPWDVTEEVILGALDTGLPVLAEKPVALSEARADQIARHPLRDNLQVGFNRRFYEFVPGLRDLIRRHPPYLVEVLSSEPYAQIVGEQGKKILPYLPHFYTSHLVDLADHLLGPLKMVSARRLREASGRSVSASLVSNSGVPVNLNVVMDSPQNSSVRLFFDDQVVLLSPIETMSAYDAMERVSTNGSATYLPHLSLRASCSTRFKPGLLSQMEQFATLCAEPPAARRFNSDAMVRVTRLCDQLSNAQQAP